MFAQRARTLRKLGERRAVAGFESTAGAGLGASPV